ncbi:MAG: AtpZ/AtpI family protein [Deltaproteobacteria bacterium]|nr:AtpZ/AtpI family protein [Deltaproteobacteria bacterium]
MDTEKRNLLKVLATVSSMGFSVVLAIAMGVIFGRFLDEWFGTGHIFFFIFLFFGIIAAFRNIYVITKKEIKNSESGENKRK